jgi:hypothetical protein
MGFGYSTQIALRAEMDNRRTYDRTCESEELKAKSHGYEYVKPSYIPLKVPTPYQQQAMDRGTQFEPTAMEWLYRLLDDDPWRIIDNGKTLWQARPWLRATPDCYLHHGPTNIVIPAELKCVNRMPIKPPLMYMFQLWSQCVATGASRGLLFMCTPGAGCVLYHFSMPDMEARFDEAIARARSFMQRFHDEVPEKTFVGKSVLTNETEELLAPYFREVVRVIANDGPPRVTGRHFVPVKLEEVLK